MIGIFDGFRGFPNQLDGDGLDARAGQSTGDIRQPGPVCLDINGHRRIAVHDRQRITPSILGGLGIRSNAHDIGAHLRDQRQCRRLAAGRHDLAEQLAVGAELGAALLDVGAGHIKFQRPHAAQRIKPPRHFGIFFDRGAPDVNDGGHLQSFEKWPVFRDETVHARALQANRVDQAAGDFDRARRWVTANGTKSDAFYDDRTKLVEIEELSVFHAITKGTRRHGDRVLQGEFTNLNREIHFNTSHAI